MDEQKTDTVHEVLAPVHTSFETAFVVDSYPYGRLRTEFRIWIESKEKLGQRVVTCTLNPKTGKYNKPHAGTYTDAIALFIETGTGHVKTAQFHYLWAEKADGFLERFGFGLSAERIAHVSLFVASNKVRAEGLNPLENRIAFYERLDVVAQEMGLPSIFKAK